jgi:iron complex outermembrane receptor protein
MIRSTIAGILCLLCSVFVFAQNVTSNIVDTLQITQLEEIAIVVRKSISDKTPKPLATIDSYLENANSVNMIRRGSYAWEPFLNGMASERSVTTIDGMRIYGACTDKMDPVTSYVEITNLARANVHSGQAGSTGATIGGSLDLERKKSTFGEKSFNGMVFGGFETNNWHKTIGTTLSYSDSRIFTDIDFTLRNAENYKAGGRKEILYSQFTKYNVSAIAGYKINKKQHIEASVIYDRAVDVGYPALPMDVSLAKAFIGSVEYVYQQVSPTIRQWQTKVYYNDVTHIMDDTKRPVVPIRMDMPGWSKTAGFYSRLQGVKKKHIWKINISGHYNQSLAEMTMYSNTPGEKDMFMLTWPGVNTNYGDLFFEDKFRISENWTSNVSIGMAVHNNLLYSQFGYESMKIFYPEIEKDKTRLLKRGAASFQYDKNHLGYNIGLAYGERAPSVSEGYGFYLFNSFDRFDYIGNPEMRNEKSVSLNGSLSYCRSKFLTKFSATYFYIADYIIGRPQNDLSVMTIGATGVKVYEQLQYANILNTSFDFTYHISEDWTWTNRFSYRNGVGYKIGDLPLIQPFTCSSTLMYSIKTFSADVTAHGSARQNRFNPEFGEQGLPAYMIVNLSVSNRFKLGNQYLMLKAGVENLFDEQYTTFADWNCLPRMGRNFFFNAIYNLGK